MDPARDATSTASVDLGLVPEGTTTVAAAYGDASVSPAFSVGVARATPDTVPFGFGGAVRMAVGIRCAERVDFVGFVGTTVPPYGVASGVGGDRMQLGLGVGVRLRQRDEASTVLRMSARADVPSRLRFHLAIHGVRQHRHVRLEGMIGGRFTERDGLRVAGHRDRPWISAEAQMAGAAHAVLGAVQLGGGLLVEYGGGRYVPTAYSPTADASWAAALGLGGTFDVQVEFVRSPDTERAYEAYLRVQPIAWYAPAPGQTWDAEGSAEVGIRLRLR